MNEHVISTNSVTKVNGFILIIMGIVLFVLHFYVSGSIFRDYCSGILLAISIVEMLVGIVAMIMGILK